MSLQINTLGIFRAHRAGALLSDSAWKTQKNRSLFKLLLTYRGHSLTKDQLIEWLWSDLDPAAAVRDLRVAISQLRGLLEPDLQRGASSRYILTTETGYAWNTAADYQLDAEDFVRLAEHATWSGRDAPSAADIAALESAVECYGGDYLEEERYADWPVAERERLQEIYFTLLLWLAEANAQRGRYGRAVALTRQVLNADRLRESVWQRLMIYYYHAGERGLALRTYDECRRALADELGVAPLAETSALAEQIRAGAIMNGATRLASPNYPPPEDLRRLLRLPISLGRLAFVGRDAECAWLLDHLRQAATGGGRILLIEGEAGIGKTRLVEEALERGEQLGATVLRVQCHEDERAVPYAPLVQLLKAVRQLVPVLFDSPGEITPLAHLLVWLETGSEPEGSLLTQSLPPDERRAHLWQLLAAVFADLATNYRPLLFFFDDLHWADSATLDFICYMDSQIGAQGALLVATYRSEEATANSESGLGQFLWQLRSRQQLERVRLGGLQQADIERLAAQAGTSGSAALSSALYAETEGNPLFLVSLLQTWFEDGLISSAADGSWLVDMPALRAVLKVGLPGTTAAAILSRVARLAPDERQVLEAAAVLGDGFEWAVLYRVRSWRRDLLLDHLDRLVGSLLLIKSASSYSFSHDKVRLAVYNAIAPEERSWLHRRVGGAIEAAHPADRDEVAATLASHFEQAALPDRAFPYRIMAAQLAGRLFAHREAAQHYEAAIALIGDDFAADDEALALAHEGLGACYTNLGQHRAAHEQLLAAQRFTATPATRVKLLYKLAHVHDILGHKGEAAELLGQARAVIDAEGPAAVGFVESSQIYARWAILNSSQHGYAGADRYASLAIEILQTHRPDTLHGKAVLSWDELDAVHSVLINSGEAYRYWDQWAQAAALFELSLQVAARQQSASSVGYSRHNMGDVLLAQGEFAQARASYASASESFSSASLNWEAMASYTHLGLAWACEGNWQSAHDALDRARISGEQIEPTEWLAEVYLWLAIVAALIPAQSSAVALYLQQAHLQAEASGAALTPAVLELALALLAYSSGDRPAASQHYAVARALFVREHGRFYITYMLRHISVAIPIE